MTIDAYQSPEADMCCVVRDYGFIGSDNDSAGIPPAWGIENLNTPLLLSQLVDALERVVA
jgi:hypothetical protein